MEDSQITRFTLHLDAIRSVMELSSDKAILKAIKTKDVRGHAFKLEGLLRLYVNLKPYRSLIKHLLRWVKGLEDQVGWYVDQGEHVQFLISLQEEKSLKAFRKEIDGAIAKLQKRADKYEGKFLKYLQKKKWIHREGKRNSLLNNIEKELEAIRWPNYSEDKAFLLGAMADYQEHVEKKLPTLNLKKFKKGIHEMRRNLRWFLIQASAMNGMVLFEESCPVDSYRALLKNEALVENNYNQLGGSERGEASARISQCLFLAQSLAVQQLGDVKDLIVAEKEFLPKVFKKKMIATVLPLHPISRRLKLQFPNAQNGQEVANAIRKDFLEHRVLSTLAKELRACK